MRSMNRRMKRTAGGWLLVASGIGMLALVVGCASSESRVGKESGSSHGVSGRPRVAQSATEVAPGGGSDQLDFFDELEKHQLATQDDALHAVLLAFHGTSAPTYVQRAAIAKQLGLMDLRVSQQPREAVTAGEVSQLLVRSLAGGQTGTGQRTTERFPTSQEALATMQEAGVVPHDWRPTRGMTGPELLAAIKNTGRLIEERKHTAAGKE